MNISVLLLTLNEAANLPACMAALAWADDVVVLLTWLTRRLALAIAGALTFSLMLELIQVWLPWPALAREMG